MKNGRETDFIKSSSLILNLTSHEINLFCKLIPQTGLHIVISNSSFAFSKPSTFLNLLKWLFFDVFTQYSIIL